MTLYSYMSGIQSHKPQLLKRFAWNLDTQTYSGFLLQKRPWCLRYRKRDADGAALKKSPGSTNCLVPNPMRCVIIWNAVHTSVSNIDQCQPHIWVNVRPNSRAPIASSFPIMHADVFFYCEFFAGTLWDSQCLVIRVSQY